MKAINQTLSAHWPELEAALDALRSEVSEASRASLARWLGDSAALKFHLSDPPERPLLVVMLGGTGAGKSTLTNRMLGAEISASSFRRTFTRGPVAIARDAGGVPPGWLHSERTEADAESRPVRGEQGRLVVAPLVHELTEKITLVDTTDLDGDTPAHHVEADLAFRWAEAVIFVVTPEKYQKTEMLPYYRLALRYRLPALFVMNKCEEREVFEDFARQLADRGWAEATPYVVARDDAAYEPPPERGIDSMRGALGDLSRANPAQRAQGLAHRASDLLDRLRDKIIAPMRSARGAVEGRLAALASLEHARGGVDVSPITTELNDRLRRRSTMYLMGPTRILDRARQLPGMIGRMPRAAWDLMVRGEKSRITPSEEVMPPNEGKPPDFRAIFIDQFERFQSRVDDNIWEDRAAAEALRAAEESYPATKLDAERAGTIVDEELAELTAWLQNKWDARPRDTRVLLKLLKHMPGGDKMTQWIEAAPYLLVVVLAAQGAAFGGADWLVIGGYSAFTWLGEKLSNEVAERTRKTNKQLKARYEALAREQLDATRKWLRELSPPADKLDRLEKIADRISEALERAGGIVISSHGDESGSVAGATSGEMGA